MKLRIRGNSVRLRLKQGEVDQVAAGESIVEETHFPGSVLTCRLDVSETNDIEANFTDGNLEISLPAQNRRFKAHSSWVKHADLDPRRWRNRPTADMSLASN